MTHPTVAQNAAHRNDIQWIKEPVTTDTDGYCERPVVPGHWWIRQYRNQFTGQTIRKSGRMTGRDWFVFDAAGDLVRQYAGMKGAERLSAGVHSLTEAKRVAAEAAAR